MVCSMLLSGTQPADSKAVISIRVKRYYIVIRMRKDSLFFSFMFDGVTS